MLTRIGLNQLRRIDAETLFLATTRAFVSHIVWNMLVYRT